MWDKYRKYLAVKYSILCLHCGERFKIKWRRGPLPDYCSSSCRQKAYRLRKKLAK